MSKKLFALAVLVLVASIFASCTYTHPICATSNAVGSKVGTASTTKLFAFFPLDNNGNIGIQKAAAKGGIKKISTVDIKVDILFLGIVHKYTTVVTGE